MADHLNSEHNIDTMNASQASVVGLPREFWNASASGRVTAAGGMGPLPRGKRWVDYVNQAETEAELRSLRRSPWMGKPYGETVWVQHTAKRLGLNAAFSRSAQSRDASKA